MKTTIKGRLTADATVNTTKSNKQLVAFNLAVNESYRNANGETITSTEYFRCAYWKTTNIAPYLTKGTMLMLTGRLKADAYINKQGQATPSLDFHIRDIEFLSGGRRKDNKAQGATAPAPAETEMVAVTEDDLPF
ncbi:single-stranded DNA-binding protein [Chitinophaga japonensis]|uniref:Single-stranded DNA-binding protein n=1 Tax=Chitinophaga japonensis TaxID=104662 RepID=A0A562T339_CHIJA|nr:single-stranded DNA-binding protein [Chitinophaga japonensis]TWI87823.1 single stranded DNA-binding protein [Chitinophaga japonensis]